MEVLGASILALAVLAGLELISDQGRFPSPLWGALLSSR